MILYPRFDSPAMAFVTNDWISSAVSAAGLNAVIEAAATLGSSATALVLMGGDMNTGWCEAGLVERMREIGLDGSKEGVRLGVVLMVEMEEVEW